MERYYDHDLEICPHSHELLISIAETTDDLPLLAVFHYWNSVHVQSSISASASSSNAIPAKLADDISYHVIAQESISRLEIMFEFLAKGIECVQQALNYDPRVNSIELKASLERYL
jgi:hypothetical protein